MEFRSRGSGGLEVGYLGGGETGGVDLGDGGRRDFGERRGEKRGKGF